MDLRQFDHPIQMASSSLTSVMKDGECVNWGELPSELTSSILGRLCAVDILENAQKVCTTWRRLCKDPSMWRKIDMRKLGCLGYDLEMMCRHAVDRSQRGLVEIDIWYFGTDSLLNYIADSLRLAMCTQITNKGLTEALEKLPLLEELEVSYCSMSGVSLKVVGKSFPKLKTLKLNWYGISPPRHVSDHDALAIAETMHELRNLQLFGNSLTDAGLKAILANCPNLEYLDLRQCFNVFLVGDLENRSSERIKVLRRPNDSHEYTYNATDIYTETSEDEE
ncbi:hypothetical protein N665_0066s0065 [Sinapis alba]|nr:hypothetical protein N665_0066s0065 [Sinapis alba]